MPNHSNLFLSWRGNSNRIKEQKWETWHGWGQPKPKIRVQNTPRAVPLVLRTSVVCCHTFGSGNTNNLLGILHCSFNLLRPSRRLLFLWLTFFVWCCHNWRGTRNVWTTKCDEIIRIQDHQGLVLSDSWSQSHGLRLYLSLHQSHHSVEAAISQTGTPISLVQVLRSVRA